MKQPSIIIDIKDSQVTAFYAGKESKTIEDIVKRTRAKPVGKMHREYEKGGLCDKKYSMPKVMQGIETQLSKQNKRVRKH